ncbi:MAG: penicillin-binding protein activator LpoB [Planctomycetota bacterium]
MNQRRLATRVCFAACLMLPLTMGCRGFQYGHLVRPDKQDMVGSHTAGSEVYKPLVEESVAKLLGACEVSLASATLAPDGTPAVGLMAPKSVCFVGIENHSAEELGDFKEHLYELIDSRISQSPSFDPLSRRVVESALQHTRLRPDSLLVPDNMQQFTAVLRRDGQPVDYLLFAKLTSGTTERNASSQRDYLLTLELVDTYTGSSYKQQAEIRKGYHKSPIGRLSSYNIFSGNR